MSIVYGIPSGGFGMPRLIEIADENGNTFVGTVTDSEVNLDATRADVKVGKKFAGNDGIEEGTDTKTYRTIHSDRLILPGENFSIELSPYDQYDYTKFQCIISKFNTCAEDSVYTEKISLGSGVYNVNSSDKVSDITKNTTSKSIDLNIVNNTEDSYVIHFNSYRKEGA